MNIRKTNIKDAQSIFKLYQLVSKIPKGLARLENEITEDYIKEFCKKAIDSGVGFVAVDDSNNVLAEIHTYCADVYCFSHVLSELTIAVSPKSQGLGLGRKIFEALLDEVKQNKPDILRIELIARESNKKAIHFYESLGFKIEGHLLNRIKNPDGSFESDIPMAWQRN